MSRVSGSEEVYLRMLPNERNKGNYPKKNVKRDKIEKLISQFLGKTMFRKLINLKISNRGR